MSATGVACTKAKFSIPAYLAAMLVASEVIAAMVLAGSWFGGSPVPPVAIIVAALIAPVAGLFALPFFLPTVLLALYFANRWKFEKPVVYGLLGSVLSGVTWLIFLMLRIWPSPEALTLAELALPFALIGGFAGGFTYRYVARQELRNIVT